MAGSVFTTEDKRNPPRKAGMALLAVFMPLVNESPAFSGTWIISTVTDNEDDERYTKAANNTESNGLYLG